MKRTSAQLLDVTSEYSDRRVASMLAEQLVAYAKTDTLRFRINHSIRPPACRACRLEYDWSLKDHIGIETKDKSIARRWLIHAALLGYKIEEVDIKHKPISGRVESIDGVRNRADYHQRAKGDPDDDIPF